MKALRFVASNLLAGAVFGISAALVLHWLDTKPKPITVAFNGWHGNSFLQAACIPLQRDADRIKILEEAANYTGEHVLPCLRSVSEMNIGIESQLVSAFASNLQCSGVMFFQGYYDPKDATTEAGKAYLRANWQLSLDIFPSSETGDVSLANSHWSLSPKSFSGSLANLEQASTAICTIVKGKGGQI